MAEITVGGVSNLGARPSNDMVESHNRLILQRYSLLQERVLDLSSDLIGIAEEVGEASVSRVANEMSIELRKIVMDVKEWTPPEDENV